MHHVTSLAPTCWCIALQHAQSQVLCCCVCRGAAPSHPQQQLVLTLSRAHLLRWRTRCRWRPQVRTAFIAGVLLCLALIPINRLIALRIQVS